MPHLIEPFTNATFDQALGRLGNAHTYLVSRARATIGGSDFDLSLWGCSVKRSPVKLDEGEVPELIGKSEEKLGEVINVAATVERLIGAIRWFAAQPENDGFTILECHPSTSDEENANDLVIIDRRGRITIRCEVCDVVSSKPGTNKKEEKDIRNLGCDEHVPEDGVRRYICTSPEFAGGLIGSRRKWKSKPYRYTLKEAGDRGETCMLLIEPDSRNEDGK